MQIGFIYGFFSMKKNIKKNFFFHFLNETTQIN